MNLKKKTWLTGCKDDGRPILELNEAQRQERSRYLRRLKSGVYVEDRRESCPLCSCFHGFLIAEKDRYGLPLRTVVCGACGFLFTQNPLNKQSAIQFYSEQYRRLYQGTDMDAEEWENCVDGYFRASRSMVDGLIGVIPLLQSRELRSLRIVEIGSGAGWNLAGFKERGASVCGYDPDSNCVESARRRGIEVKLGLIENALQQGEQADVVILNHSLEHVLDPVDVLEKCKQLIKPHGCVFIGVPGLRSFLFGNWGGGLKHQLQSAHISIYDETTFRATAARAGLSVCFYTDLIWCVLEAAPVVSCQMPVNRGAKVLRFLALLRVTEYMWRGLARVSGGVSSGIYGQASRIASALGRRVGILK
jgi:SAM-dependent methyltransferase